MMEEKMIPVIGVPPTPSASSLQAFPDKNAPKPPPKNASRIKNPVIPPKPKKQPKMKGKPNNKPTNNLAPLMKKIKISSLIKETGLPPIENGPFVLAEEAKLTPVEKMAQSYWVEANVLLDPGATNKQCKKHSFKMRLFWLLNKKVMLNATNLAAMENKVARKANRELKKLHKNQNNPEKEISKPIKEETMIRVDLTHLTPEKASGAAASMRKLMDVEVSKPRDGLLKDFKEKNSVRIDSGRQEVDGGGYQYLNDDWYNADKPWRNFQTSASQNPTSSVSSSDFYTSYNDPTSLSTTSDPAMMAQWAQMAPTSSMDPYGSFPMTSSYLGFSVPHQQPSFGATTDFTSPPPTISSFKDSLAQMLASRQVPDTPPGALAPGVSPGYVSQYRQAFPIDSQYSIPQPQSVQPTSSSPYTQQALEVSEEELARQKRLLEIEEELRMINARKVQMQMEEEIRQREFELALQTQRMQERERRMRDRDEYSSHSHRRHRHDDRGSSSASSRNDDYYQQRGSPQSSSYSDRHQYSSSSSNAAASTHQPISIEQESGGGRRYGGQLLLLSQQNKMRDALPRDGQECFQSSSLKRQADHGYDYDEYNDNGEPRSMIRPAKAPRRRNRRNRAAEEEHELQMQAISDDED